MEKKINLIREIFLGSKDEATALVEINKNPELQEIGNNFFILVIPANKNGKCQILLKNKKTAGQKIRFFTHLVPTEHIYPSREICPRH